MTAFQKIAIMALCFVGIIVLVFLNTTRITRLQSKSDRLDLVCEHVREALCGTRNGIDHRPGSEYASPPSDVEIDACAPGVWNDRKLARAMKGGDYESELRSQVDQAIRAIPTPEPDVEECR